MIHKKTKSQGWQKGKKHNQPYLPIPHRKLTWQWKIHHLKRCIFVFQLAILVFRGVSLKQTPTRIHTKLGQNSGLPQGYGARIFAKAVLLRGAILFASSLGGVWGKVSFEVKSRQVQKLFVVLDANQHTHRQTIGSFSSNFGPKEGPLHSKLLSKVPGFCHPRFHGDQRY